MTEIREVVSRIRLPRRLFEERFPEFQIHPSAGLDTVEIEEVYRLAGPGETGGALLIEGSKGNHWPSPPRHSLVLRGVRLRSGRWLTPQNLPTQQAPDAEQQAPAC